MRLYHRTREERASSILKDGFKDGSGYYDSSQIFRGVWFSDRPLEINDGVTGDALIAVDLPIQDADLADFEWIEEGKPYREWLVPAELINLHGLFTLLSSDDPHTNVCCEARG